MILFSLLKNDSMGDWLLLNKFSYEFVVNGLYRALHEYSRENYLGDLKFKQSVK